MPLSVDMTDLAREQPNVCYTPELVEFLKTYEFRSLLPSHHEGNHTLFSLKTPPTVIDSSLAEMLWQRIEQNEAYTFVTRG